MKLNRVAMTMLLCAAGALTAWAAGPKLEGVMCIVNPKGPAKAEKAVDYRGGKVFFCCDNCPKAFAANTKKFAAVANHQLVATGQAKQTKCPLTGRDLNPSITVAVGGVDVGLCCNNCKAKVSRAKGKAQVQLVFNDKSFDNGFAVAKAAE